MVHMGICQFDEDNYAKLFKAYRCHGARAKMCEKHCMVQISWCAFESVSETFHGAHVDLVHL